MKWEQNRSLRFFFLLLTWPSCPVVVKRTRSCEESWSHYWLIFTFLSAIDE